MAALPRFYVPLNVAPGYDGIREGLRWLLRWVGDHSEHGVPLIIAPSLGQLRDIDLLAAACSRMHCASERTWRRSAWDRSAPVLVLFPDRDLLGEVDELARSAMCVVPSPREPIDYWVRARSAVDVTGTSVEPEPSELIANPVVREAMRTLSAFVNKAHLVNYEDRAMAVRVLKVLQRNREAFQPEELHAWALADGWSADAAGRLRDLADGVAAGRRFQLKSSIRPRPDAIRRWRKAATGEEA